MNFLKSNPARVRTLLVAVIGLLTALRDGGVLGLAGGEVVQCVENLKTLKALLSPSLAQGDRS